MAEEEVNYASVVFKTKKRPQSKVKQEEETVYDDVKVQNEATEQTTPDTNASSGLLTVKKADSRCHHYQWLACCLGTLCVILVLGIIAVIFYQQQIRNLTAENMNLNERNQELNTKKKNLTEQIQSLKTAWNEFNVSRAQWSVDAYCPKDNSGRKCQPCQKDWLSYQSSCYAINNAEYDQQKSWEEARENCRGKNSDLVVVINEEEKKYVSDNSWKSQNIEEYWIGLKAEDGKWKWVDGIDLTENSWMQHVAASDSQCAISVQNEGFKSVSCDKKNRWICKKKALSV